MAKINLKIELHSPTDTIQCEYHINNYPDGQKDLFLVSEIPENFTRATVYISIVDFSCVEILMALKSIFDRLEIGVTLYINYLLGARSDRYFYAKGSNYIRDVIGAAINNLCFKAVIIFEPHSDVALGAIKNSCAVNWEPTIEADLIVYPDYGAYKRYSKSYGTPYEVYSKIRIGNSVEINPTPIETNKEFTGKGTIIVRDDICDGGATFIEVGKILKKKYPEASLTLVVAHGIFSKGVEALLEIYSQIVTTNSYNQIIHPNIRTHECRVNC